MRVLVADDDPLIRAAICEILSVAGIETGDAGTHQTTLELMSSAGWDVLLVDLLLPDARTGLDLATRAHTLGMRCVIMSGALEHLAAVEAKGVQFIAKPFRASDL